MLKWLISRLSGEGTVSAFDLREQIFVGAFSDIYIANHKKTGQEVALKVLTESGVKIARMLDEDPSTRWEGELLMSFDHPNIVECFDYGSRGDYWIAMEYIESHLGSYIGRCRNVEQENKLIDVMSQAAGALHYVHEQGLLHRDVCLANLLMDESGTVKLIDFGMSVPVGSKVVKGRVGTPSYMAPEMIREWKYTKATDIYSFGIVMYELITGEKPFRGAMRHQRMTRSLNVEPNPPSEMGKHCSPELEEVVMKCISKDPEQRPADAQHIRDSLFLLKRKRGMA